MFFRQVNKCSLRVVSSVSRLSSTSSTNPTAQQIQYAKFWGSNAEQKIAEVPVIEVAGRVAVCEGGSGALGHPIQYMQLDRVNPNPVVCKYCGLRYKMGKLINRFGKERKFHAH